MIFQQLFDKKSSTYTYVISSGEGREALIIDPVIEHTEEYIKILESLKEGGKIIFIRHAYAPGGGDPQNFNINDCSTQRNLSDEGINQSKLIGEFTLKIQKNL